MVEFFVRWRGPIVALVTALALGRTAEASSASGPVPPCAASTEAPYPDFADPPTARSWEERDLPPGRTPLPCLGWQHPRFTLLTALAGKFLFKGTAEELLAKFDAQSAWRGVLYWLAARAANIRPQTPRADQRLKRL